MSRPHDLAALSPDMTVLEVIQRYRSTERVFKDLEAETGHCICCDALFEPLQQVARLYQLDLANLLDRLNGAKSCEAPADP